MGNSSGGGRNTKDAPPQAETIDYAALMKASSDAAAAQVKAQAASVVKYYPDMERLQFGTVQNAGTMLSEEGGKLYSWRQTKGTGKGKDKKPGWEKIEIGEANPNLYTGKARAAVEEAMGSREPIALTGDKLQAIGDWVTQRAAESYANSGPTDIEGELYRQGASDLALGRSLSPEQLRDAQQSARSSMGARGLGTSMATTAAEILNRDAYGSQREAERRNFAGAANDMLMRNVMSRRDQAAQQAALGSNVLGNSAQIYGQGANIGMQGAQNLAALDPIRSGMGLGAQMAGGIQGNMMGLVGNTYTNATNMAGNVSSFNANAQNWANYAPLAMGQGGSQQSGAAGGGWAGAASGAASGAAMGTMISPGYGTAVGGVVGGVAGYFSDKRLKKNIKDNEYGLEDISKLKTYQYDYKDGADNEAGVMAQELRKVMPEAVTEAEIMDGKKKVKRLMIKPMFLTAALVNSVKELNEKVAALGSSVKAPTKPKTSKALGEALMELV
jgi:hypothetical protein